MLELPECQTLARQFRETLTGKTISQVVANASPHGLAWYFGDPALYDERARGSAVTGADAQGGFAEIHAGHMRLLFQDGVRVLYLPSGAPPPKKHQLLVRFDDDSALVCTVQMYGGMLLFAQGEHDDNKYYAAARELPSPLSGAFDSAYFDALFSHAKPTLSAKAFLATEQRIPGLGNGVLQDILFRAGVHPKAKLKALTDAQRERMYHSVKETLADMTAKGGRDTEKDFFGDKGGYATLLSKNTVQHPCPVCAGGLVRQAYLGGNIYFCPTCQPL